MCAGWQKAAKHAPAVACGAPLTQPSGTPSSDALAEMKAFGFHSFWYPHLGHYIENFPQRLKDDPISARCLLPRRPPRRSAPRHHPGLTRELAARDFLARFCLLGPSSRRVCGHDFERKSAGGLTRGSVETYQMGFRHRNRIPAGFPRPASAAQLRRRLQAVVRLRWAKEYPANSPIASDHPTSPIPEYAVPPRPSVLEVRRATSDQGRIAIATQVEVITRNLIHREEPCFEHLHPLLLIDDAAVGIS